MALDYQYTLRDGMKHGQMEDEDFAVLIPALTELERKTGFTLDRYGDTRLYPDHARILATALADSRAPHICELCDDLRAAAELGAIIYFYGD